MERKSNLRVRRPRNEVSPPTCHVRGPSSVLHVETAASAPPLSRPSESARDCEPTVPSCSRHGQPRGDAGQQGRDLPAEQNKCKYSNHYSNQSPGEPSNSPVCRIGGGGHLASALPQRQLMNEQEANFIFGFCHFLKRPPRRLKTGNTINTLQTERWRRRGEEGESR